MGFLSTLTEPTYHRDSSFSHTEDDWRLMLRPPFLPVAQILPQELGKPILQVNMSVQKSDALDFDIIRSLCSWYWH